MRMRGLTKREQNWIIHSLKFLIWLVGATTGSLSSSTSRTAKASRCVPPPDHDDLVLQQIVSVKFIEKTYPFKHVQRHLGRRVSLLAQKSTTIHGETRGANNAYTRWPRVNVDATSNSIQGEFRFGWANCREPMKSMLIFRKTIRHPPAPKSRAMVLNYRRPLCSRCPWRLGGLDG